jgi:hypothetical protein
VSSSSGKRQGRRTGHGGQQECWRWDRHFAGFSDLLLEISKWLQLSTAISTR